MSAKSTRAAAFVSVFAFLLAGCTVPAPSPTTGEQAVTLQYFPHPGLGMILADPAGRALYVFTNDDPGKSNCYDQCAANWPPYLLEMEPGGPGDVADELGLVERTDGKQQAAYRDRPLYYWAKDVKGGDATGDGVGGIWFVVRQPPASDEELNGRGEFEVDAEDVTYHPSTTGYFAKPRGTESPTGVVMIHEWWGLNDNIREMGEILASHGYAVLAVDLFKGNVAATSQEAQTQVGALNQAEATANMQAAADYLRGEGVEEVAVLGWCFGGGQALQLSMSGEELVATVIYYGFLVTDESKLEPIDWPVLGIFGEKDQAISVPTVRAFETALGNLTIENDIYIYPDVGHAFANPSGDGWAP
ncbi:MAG TPA: dienelactone hydrolase family protein, partial [Candidatus Thermoplasmatota archaeon]